MALRRLPVPVDRRIILPRRSERRPRDLAPCRRQSAVFGRRPVSSGAPLRERHSSGHPRPNILLITTDQQRFDTLGLHGNPLVRTPNLDALARPGTVFDNAFVQNPICIPSRACIQTGRYTHQHGLRYMEDVIDDTLGLPAWELTFMERLQAAGYRTAAFGKIHMMPEKGFHELQVCGGKGARWTQPSGLPIGLGPLGRDYAAWLEARRPGAYDEIYHARRQPDYQTFATAVGFPLGLDDYVDTWIADNTAELVARDHDRPFFAWCGFCGPHPPIDPPAPYDTMYPPDDVPLPANYRFSPDGSERPTTPRQDPVARRWIACYYGLVTMLDDTVGRIVASLQRAGVLDNTLIVFTSDHGEMMWDFGRLHKGNFYEPVVHVPLIVAPPGGAPVCPRADGLVEVFDIAPTLLDYAGAEVPASMAATSLRPMVERDAAGRDLVLSEFVTGDRQRYGTCVRTDRHKYVVWGPDDEELLFDLRADPHERRDLAADPAARDDRNRLRMRMLDRLVCTP